MKEKNASYNRILRSTAIFGGSQFITVIVGVIRTKIFAILLGGEMIGIIGIYQSLVDTIRTAGCMGVDTSAVKKTAEVAHAKDADSLGKTIASFNKLFKIASLIGLLLSPIACYFLGNTIFEGEQMIWFFIILAVSVVCSILATGKLAIMQGMQNISGIFKSTIFTALFSLLLVIVFFYHESEDINVFSVLLILVASNIFGLVCTYIYYNKLRIKKTVVSLKEAYQEGVSSLRLGLYIVISGFIATAGMLLVRILIVQELSLFESGLFQAVWVITNVYLGLLLKSMGTDFFPRLSAIADNKEKMNKLVNEQTYIVLIIATPLVVAMLTLAHYVVMILYSSEFSSATSVLKWQTMGTFLKVLGWPISFIFLAKNKGLLFLISEVTFYVVYLLSTYLLLPVLSLDAVGIGYLIAYVVYLPLIFIMGKKISSFGWNKEIVKMITASSILITCAALVQFSAWNKENLALYISASVVIFIVSVLYSYSKLKAVFNISDLRGWFRRK